MSLPVLTSPLLDLPGVRHAFFTRQGGASSGIYDSLNVGAGSKDDPEAVVENKRRIAAHFGRPEQFLAANYQIHSALAVTLDDEAQLAEARREADGLVTALPGVICGALSADCAPILMADPEARVIAAVHAGWKGAIDGVIQASVEAMMEKGAELSRIRAVVGPCIAPQSYEVGLEFLDRFTAVDPAFETFFSAGVAPDKRQFDLPGFVLSRLRAAGVTQCEWIGRDTCAEPDLFFSNRRAFKAGEPDYGRLLSAIMLEV